MLRALFLLLEDFCLGWNSQVPNKSQGILWMRIEGISCNSLEDGTHPSVRMFLCQLPPSVTKRIFRSIPNFNFLVLIFQSHIHFLFGSNNCDSLMPWFFYRKNQQGVTTALELRYGLIAMAFDFTLTSMRSFEVTSYIWPSEYFV